MNDQYATHQEYLDERFLMYSPTIGQSSCIRIFRERSYGIDQGNQLVPTCYWLVLRTYEAPKTRENKTDERKRNDPWGAREICQREPNKRCLLNQQCSIYFMCGRKFNVVLEIYRCNIIQKIQIYFTLFVALDQCRKLEQLRFQ